MTSAEVRDKVAGWTIDYAHRRAVFNPRDSEPTWCEVRGGNLIVCDECQYNSGEFEIPLELVEFLRVFPWEGE